MLEVKSPVYALDFPWSGVGKTVLNKNSVLSAAELDWKVRKVPSYITLGNAQIPTGRSALVRSPHDHLPNFGILSIVPDDWESVQNEAALEYFQKFMEAMSSGSFGQKHGPLEMVSAGSIHDGALVWALAAPRSYIEDEPTVPSVERIPFVLFTNPHKYGWSTNARMLVAFKGLAWNSIVYSLKQETGSGDLELKPKGVDRIVAAQAAKEFDRLVSKFDECSQHLLSSSIGDDEAETRLRALFPSASKTKGRQSTSTTKVIDALKKGRYPGTLWNLFDSAVYAMDHVLGRADDTRLSSSWYGINRKRKVRIMADLVSDVYRNRS